LTVVLGIDDLFSITNENSIGKNECQIEDRYGMYDLEVTIFSLGLDIKFNGRFP